MAKALAPSGCALGGCGDGYRRRAARAASRRRGPGRRGRRTRRTRLSSTPRTPTVWGRLRRCCSRQALQRRLPPLRRSTSCRTQSQLPLSRPSACSPCVPPVSPARVYGKRTSEPSVLSTGNRPLPGSTSTTARGHAAAPNRSCRQVSPAEGTSGTARSGPWRSAPLFLTSRDRAVPLPGGQCPAPCPGPVPRAPARGQCSAPAQAMPRARARGPRPGPVPGQRSGAERRAPGPHCIP